MKKNRIVVPVSILLIVLALGKIFLSTQKEKIKKENEALMSGIREIMMNKKNRAEIAIDSLLKTQGQIFVYTNDTTVKLGWAPNITNNYSYGNIKSMVAESVSYDEFVNKRDSLGFLLLLNHADKYYFTLNKNVLFGEDTTIKRLWFLGLDSKDKLPKDSAAIKRNPYIYNKIFTIGWGEGFNDISNVNTKSLTSFCTESCILYLKTIEGFKFYMAGYKYDNGKPGIDSLEFRKVMQVVNKLFHVEGVDTTKFMVKMF